MTHCGLCGVDDEDLTMMDGRISALRDALDECLEYFADRGDAEYFPDSPGPVANTEMRLAVMIKDVLQKDFRR